MSDSPNRPGPSSAAGDPARATDAARPASPAQHGIWLTSRLTHVPEVFHLALRIGFDRIDTGALARAVAATVARHPALSSALVERDGVLHPVPAGRAPALTVLEPGGEPLGECADACADALAKRLAEELALPFDLARGPLARFALERRADGSAELLVVAHHAVFDGNSKDVLVADLAAGYAAALASAAADGGGDGGSARGSATATVTALGAEAEADTDAAPLDPELLARAAAFHGPRWAAATAPVLPGGPRAVTDAGPGESVAWRLDRAAAAALADAARTAGVTRFEFLLAALHGLLHRYGGEAVPVAVPFSTRGPRQRGTIGLYVNELPVHAPAGQDEDTPFARYAAAVRAEARLVSAHRAVPFGSAVPGLTPRAGLASATAAAPPPTPSSPAAPPWSTGPSSRTRPATPCTSRPSTAPTGSTSRSSTTRPCSPPPPRGESPGTSPPCSPPPWPTPPPRSATCPCSTGPSGTWSPPPGTTPPAPTPPTGRCSTWSGSTPRPLPTRSPWWPRRNG
ncbi:condensation domain-containing protein [Streptomyces sp. NRRL S-495]|uniref:condensation domain-containing protein n=1 Tax=Streptomyces sp. NRRL S-495 TaxID=1609133 RepID=UPI000696B336|nr:condensation domain-containing protein [Streptomyces sp. NRRL S-495]